MRTKKLLSALLLGSALTLFGLLLNINADAQKTAKKPAARPAQKTAPPTTTQAKTTPAKATTPKSFAESDVLFNGNRVLQISIELDEEALNSLRGDARKYVKATLDRKSTRLNSSHLGISY